MFSGLLFLFGCISWNHQGLSGRDKRIKYYLGIAVGAAIGGIISWCVYYRQKKIAEVQDLTLNRIKASEKNQEAILKRIQDMGSHHEEALNKILDLAKKIDMIIEKQRILESKKSSSTD